MTNVKEILGLVHALLVVLTAFLLSNVYPV